MYKLISAGYAKLFKSLCFKVYIGFGLLYSVFNVIERYWNIHMLKIYIAAGEMTAEGFSLKSDSILFDCAMTMLLAAAVFTAMFIGREHEDGAVRNKLIVGYSRSAVYLSSLIVCITANLGGMLFAFGTTLALAVPIMGTNLTAELIAQCTVYMIAANIAVSAFFVFVAMVVSKKAVSCAAVIISLFVFLMIATGIESRLAEQEYYTDFEMVINEDGEPSLEITEGVENPYYITGVKREVYEVLDKALPVAQLYRLAGSGDVSGAAVSFVGDLVILIGTSVVGVIVFGKKNIR